MVKNFMWSLFLDVGDECLEGGRCEHGECVRNGRSRGTYTCKCDEGYQLSPSSYKCQGK